MEQRRLATGAAPLPDQCWLHLSRTAEKDMTTQMAGGARNVPWPVTVPLPSGLTMTPMELVDESAIQNVASRKPASLLRTITLPVYQVLVASTPTPHINKSPYHIGRRPLDESGRRGGRGLGLKGRANDGFDLRYMKNRVNVLKRGG